MPLTEGSLKARLETNIRALFAPALPTDEILLEKFCEAVAKSVVDEIQASALVTVPGVMTGPSTVVGTVS